MEKIYMLPSVTSTLLPYDFWLSVYVRYISEELGNVDQKTSHQNTGFIDVII